MNKNRLLLSLLIALVVLFGLKAWNGSALWPHPGNVNFPGSAGVPPASAETLPNPMAHPSPAALAFGEKQVERMVADRPQMKQYVQKGDSVWQYCARQFAGEACGQKITWNPDPPHPPDDYDADHQYPTDTQQGYIRIRRLSGAGAMRGKERNGEDMWQNAIFELNNIRSAKQFDRLFEDALAGKLSKEQWIKGNTQLEYTAYRNSVRIYRILWLPLMRSKGIASNPDLWWPDLPDTYEAWIALYTDKSSYPWDSWGKSYDDDIVPYLKSKQR